jgi:hypothetical protein
MEQTMGKSKLTIIDYFLLLTLGLFPFGVLPGIFFKNIFNLPFRLHPIDLVVSATVIFMILNTDSLKRIMQNGYIFVVILFSTLFSLFGSRFDFYGLIYLGRLIVYLMFFMSLTLKTNKTSKTQTLKLLILVGLVIGVFGWIQYFLFADLTNLKYFGWDDHYFRLVSTFLDPAFNGVLLVLSILSAIVFYLLTKNKLILPTILFLLVSLGFTYSRASFLALVIGLSVLLYKSHKRSLLLFVLLLLFIIFSLPQSPGGEGVKLTRVSSIEQKVENYATGFRLISTSPLLGIGYNNICSAKKALNIDISQQINSCYGLDNSFLLVWASMGILGLLSVSWYFVGIYKDTVDDIYGMLFKASTGAVLFHALFTNTLFYPWVIVWIAFLMSASRSLGVVKRKF